MNCWVTPFGMLGFPGVTVIICSTAVFTVNAVLPEIEPIVALTTDAPAAAAVARPAVLIVATAGVPELHVTTDVRS
jgi:hypothetical protein